MRTRGWTTRRGLFRVMWGAALLFASAGTALGVAGDDGAAVRGTVETAPTAGPLHYDGHFGGFRVADITLTLDGGSGTYATRMDIDARGVVGWLYTWHGTLQSAGRLADDRRPQPRSFSRAWKDTRQEGTTVIAFDPQTGEAQGIEDGEPQDQVPAHLRRNVVDPLAALVAMRRLVLLDRQGRAVFQVYDGKRRLDLHATLGEPRTTEIARTEVEVIEVATEIEPRAGFSDRQRDGWSKTRLHVLFSADDRALPVQIRVHSPVGTAIMTLSCIGSCV